MNLIDAPVDTQEQNNEYAAHNAANALREAKYGRQHELPFVAGNCFEELTWRWQPSNQCLLERGCLPTILAASTHPAPIQSGPTVESH